MIQPKTSRKLSKDEAVILAKAAKNMSIVSKGLKENMEFSTDLPLIVGFKLTNRCNLRCKTCYEWNEQGYHHNMSEAMKNKELDPEIFDKVMKETSQVKSSVYLWGGEPLFHTEFTKISKIMEREQRVAAMCTNGILIEKRMDDILRFDKDLELLIAVDGFEEENDEIRGKGNYQKVMTNIKTLLDMRRKGEFHGKISIHCVLSGSMVDKMYDFLEYMEELGVDYVIVCFPWYIAPETSDRMDQYYAEHFGTCRNSVASWHAFKFKYPEDEYEKIFAIHKRISERVWKMQVKFQPNLELDQIVPFLEDRNVVEDSYCCYSVADRIEVLPDGTLTTCKHFPEFVVGDLNKNTVREIWKNDAYNRIRRAIQSGNMPVCTKCNNLYLHGRKHEKEN